MKKTDLEKLDLIRQYFPNAGITTDIIIGFPTETNDDFYESLDFAKQANFSEMHIFPYSKRNGTVAEKIKNYDAFLVAYEAEDGLTLSNFLISNKPNLKNIAIMIGAEGGFSEKEIEMLKTSGAKIVSLGNRILRTETASIVCAGLAMQILEQ